MYNPNHISKYIDSVHKLASEAAQSVYDEYLPKLEDMIRNQLRAGDKVNFGMGLTSIINGKGEDIAEKLESVLTPLNYWDKVKAGFDLGIIEIPGYIPPKIKSKRIRLSKKNLAELESGGTSVLLKSSIPVSKDSILFGEGSSYLWDKVDRVWVYGDIKSYISLKMNVGRRSKDYPDNTTNTWSGCHWWEEYYNCPKDLKVLDTVNDKYVVSKIQIINIHPLIYKIDLI